MTTKTANFQFSLNNVPGDPIDFRTRQNVKKRFASIVYLESPPQDSVRLDFVGSKEITPTSNLFIGDRSNELYANASLLVDKEFVFSSSPTVVNSSFIVTQEYNVSSEGNLPLYYKHVLPIDIIPGSVKVFDKDFNEVNSSLYSLIKEEERDEDTADILGYISYSLFNSLESSFDIDTGEYTVYYVQYIDRTTGSDVIVTELLSNELAYMPAKAEDYWHVTLDLKPWVRVYAYDPISSNQITMSTPNRQTYVKYLSIKRISVERPVDLTDMSPWFVRVKNGNFSHAIGTDPITYSIPEFENQAFNPLQPYKFAARVSCSKISDTLVKLAHSNISLGSMFSYIYLIFEEEGIAKFAITNDPSYSGMTYTDFSGQSILKDDGTLLTWNTDYFLSIDKYSGIVNTGFKVLDSYDVYGLYSYEEEFYTLTGLVMNPIIDRLAHKQTRVVYLVPRAPANNNLANFDMGIHYLKVSSSGIIESANQDSSVEDFSSQVRLLDTDGFDLVGVLGLHYSWSASTTNISNTNILPSGLLDVVSTSSFPRSGWLRAVCSDGKLRYFKYTDKEDTYFILSSDSNYCPTNDNPVLLANTTIELVNWKNEFSTSSSHIPSTELSSYGGTTRPSLYRQYFVLAEMSINPSLPMNDLTIINVRENGGGIDPDRYEEAKYLNPEVQWYNDYAGFEGQVYPGKSVCIIKLPYSLTERLSSAAIREIVQESIPVGVYPLIRYYGYEPRILSIVPGASINTVDIEWEKEGSEFSYQIWYAYNSNGPWIKAHNYRLVDGAGTTNTFTITGLQPNRICYVKITIEDNYYKWWYSYSDYDSIDGGYGLIEETPVAPFGNIANYTFTVI